LERALPHPGVHQQGRVGHHSQHAERSDPDDLHQIPFNWATKSKNSNSSLYKNRIQGKCLTLFDCDGGPTPCNCPKAPEQCEKSEKHSYYDTRREIREDGGILKMDFHVQQLPVDMCWGWTTHLHKIWGRCRNVIMQLPKKCK